MDIGAIIKEIIIAYDHSLVQIPVELSLKAKGVRLLQSTVDKYSPLFLERCQSVAYSLLFLNLKAVVPGVTRDVFVKEFLNTQTGLVSFHETLEFVSATLPQTVSVEKLQEFLKKN